MVAAFPHHLFFDVVVPPLLTECSCVELVDRWFAGFLGSGIVLLLVNWLTVWLLSARLHVGTRTLSTR